MKDVFLMMSLKVLWYLKVLEERFCGVFNQASGTTLRSVHP